MSKGRMIRRCAYTLMSLLFVQAAGAGIISPISGDVEVEGATGSNPMTTHDITLGTLPFSTSDSVSGTGFQTNGVYALNSTMLNVATTAQRSGTSGSIDLVRGAVNFTVSSPSTYSAIGNYLVRETSPTIAGNALFSVNLRDNTTNQTLFAQYSVNHNTPSSSFILGVPQGDFSSLYMGSLAGILSTTDSYTFNYQLDNSTNGPAISDLGSTSTGFLSLQVTASATAVPLPGSLAGGLFAGAIIAIVARKKRLLSN